MTTWRGLLAGAVATACLAGCSEGNQAPASGEPSADSQITDAKIDRPTGRPIFRETFGPDSSASWQVSRVGDAALTWEKRGATLSVARLDGGDAVSLSRPLHDARGVMIHGRARINKAGCNRAAPPTNGNVPLFRLYDDAGDRRLSVFRENGSCGPVEQLLVQAGPQYDKTTARLRLGRWFRFSVVARTGAPGRGRLTVWINGRPVHHTAHAELGERHFARLVLGNDSPGQPGSITYASVRAAKIAGGAQAPTCAPDPAVPEVGQLYASGLGRLETGWDITRRGGSTAFVRRLPGGDQRCGLRVASSTLPESEIAVLRHVAPHRRLSARARLRVTAGNSDDLHVPLLTIATRHGQQIVETFRDHQGVVWVETEDADRGTAYFKTPLRLDEGQWVDLALTVDGATGAAELVADGETVFAEDGLRMRRAYPAVVALASWHDQAYVVDLDWLGIRGGAR